MTKYPVGIVIYKFFCLLFYPLIIFYYKYRKYKGKEDRLRFNERLGVPSIERPEGKVIWFHCSSVGEVLSALPVISMLEKKVDANFLITSGTITSAKILENKLSKNIFHQYIPIDLNKYNNKFINHWKPDLVFWVESELWPNILLLLQKNNIKHLMINARMSENSFKKWKYFFATARKILSGFDTCFTQSKKDEFKFKFFEMKHVINLGNFKYFSPKLKFDEEQFIILKKVLEKRSVWLAASTHEGEELLVTNIHKTLVKKYPIYLQ